MTTDVEIEGKAVSSIGESLTTERGFKIYRFIIVADTLTPEKEYFEIETWDELAEKCEMECKKGTLIRVEGRLKKDWVESIEDFGIGGRIIAERVECL